MAPLRIRHAKGIATIDLDLENATVLELQQEIRAVTGILPSLQDVKTGFPPKSITLVSELSLSSLGLKRGDQLIISELKATPTSSAAAPTPAAAPVPSRPAQIDRYNPPPPQPAPKVAQPAQAPKPVATPRAATPAPTTVPPALSAFGEEPEQVTTASGILVHRVVPDDNSCLFSSIGIVFEQDMGAASKLRQVIGDAIRKDPIKYDDATLGRPQQEYIRTITSSSAWGGAIELAIFSEHYQTEITSIDVETGRCDRFGEGQNPHPSRAILLYSGIHYDAISLSPMPNAPLDFHTTVFPVSDAPILEGSLKLASQLRQKKKFTNTATFDLKCEQCGVGLVGEKGAREHAAQTGHTSFGEY
ncbi:hypothetical protein M408DRAFT_331259 [Serendipita vermifera MAFF 305830]|uniref:Ubiquitin thioesterase OTU n=1 Tax=Serendipita vermifera MAFF 305830 TaxID=933852 RepID=A0A0C2WFZ2_SERVB|nr:hypothetical protein M408DRAFT_331259 [Serendipita vermifera MAFF 305830]